MMRCMRSLKSLKLGSFLFLFAVLLIAGVAATPAALPTPTAPTAVATSDAGEIRVAWPPVSGAQFYTVGWINRNDYNRIGSSGDWLSAFHYATIPSPGTDYTVSGLKSGEEYWTIVGARMARVGGEPPSWSAWSGLVTTSGQHGADFCPITGLPLPPGGYLSVGDAAESVTGTFTLTGVTEKADVQIGTNKIEPASNRQFIKVCGRYQSDFDSFLFISGLSYQVDTDAGIGFSYVDEDTTTWSNATGGRSRTGCEVWDVPATATTAVIAVNPNTVGSIGEALSTGDVSLYSVDLP